MTWTLKQRPHVAGAPMTADYECPTHGRFEALVERDAVGDPPADAECPASVDAEYRVGSSRPIDLGYDLLCRHLSPWRISAPALKRDSVPCYAAERGGDTDRRPGMLDTRPLAEGMSHKDWKAKQTAARQERRHQTLIKRGLKTRRVQV
jgi:hypothetical protein